MGPGPHQLEKRLQGSRQCLSVELGGLPPEGATPGPPILHRRAWKQGASGLFCIHMELVHHWARGCPVGQSCPLLSMSDYRPGFWVRDTIATSPWNPRMPMGKSCFHQASAHFCKLFSAPWGCQFLRTSPGPPFPALFPKTSALHSQESPR